METRFLNRDLKMKQSIKQQYDQEQDALHNKRAESGLLDEFDITAKKKNTSKKVEEEGDDNKESEVEGGADAGTNL